MYLNLAGWSVFLVLKREWTLLNNNYGPIVESSSIWIAFSSLSQCFLISLALSLTTTKRKRRASSLKCGVGSQGCRRRGVSLVGWTCVWKFEKEHNWDIFPSSMKNFFECSFNLKCLMTLNIEDMFLHVIWPLDTTWNGISCPAVLIF